MTEKVLKATLNPNEQQQQLISNQYIKYQDPTSNSFRNSLPKFQCQKMPNTARQNVKNFAPNKIR